MKPGPHLPLFLAAALLLAAGTPAAAQDNKADPATILALKRVAERYALTKTRIAALLDKRMKPTPLAANLPNPFFHSPDLPATADGARVSASGPSGEAAESAAMLPPAADESDLGTLTKFTSTLKISGLTVRNGVQFLTLNGTLCKAGDIIPIDGKGRTVYIQVVNITPDELTLGLNEERQVIRVRK